MSEFQSSRCYAAAVDDIVSRPPRSRLRAREPDGGQLADWDALNTPQWDALRYLVAFAGILILFGADLLTQQRIGVSILYVPVIAIAVGSGRRRTVVWTAWLSVLLTVFAFGLELGVRPLPVAIGRLSVSLLAIGLATIFILRVFRTLSPLPSQGYLFDQAHESIVVRDLHGRLTYWNKAAAELYGWSSGEVRGHLSEHLLGTRYPIDRSAIMRRLLDYGIWEGEILNTTHDGREVQIDARWSLIRGEDNDPVGIFEVGNDVTRQRAADDALRIGEARHRTIFQTAGIAIYECDASAIKARCDAMRLAGVGDFRAYAADHPEFLEEVVALSRIVDVNQAGLTLFEAGSPDALVGNFGRICSTDAEPSFAEAILAALEKRPSFEAEAVLLTLSGTRLEVLLATSFPPGMKGWESIFVTLVDVSASNRAKAELQSAQTDLAHAMRLTSLGELTATIAHEVNQPLGGIIANGQAALRWLRQDPPNFNAMENAIEQSVAEARRAGDVVSTIRGMARKTMPLFALFDLDALVDETIALLRSEIRRAEIDLRLDPQGGPKVVLANRGELQQVVINLVTNSIQALAAVSDRPRRLTITTHGEPKMIVFTIDDNGVGIPVDIRARTFTPFFTTKPEGMGIGLSVCASIIERHGGHIGIEPKDGPGLRTGFSLPAPDGHP